MMHRWFAWTVCGATLALFVPFTILALVNRNAPEVWAIVEPQSALGVSSAAIVGVVLATRRPRNAIGWLLLAHGFLGQAAHLLSLWGVYGLETRPGVPGAAIALWSGLWLSVVGFAATPSLLVLLFPDGRLGRRFPRIVAALAVVGAMVVLLGLMTGNRAPPGFPLLYERTANPLALERPLLDPGNGIILLSISSALAVALLLKRFVNATGTERQQYKWIVLAMSAVVATFILDFVVRANDSGTAFLTSMGLSLSISFVPITIGIAILRHQLFDIDRVIKRTVVYSSLTIGLVAAYGLIVLVSQSFLSPVIPTGNLEIAVTTLIVAALFQPLRARIQKIVDLNFNRAHYDAVQTIESFANGLREEVDLQTVELNLQAVVVTTMQPAHVSL